MPRPVSGTCEPKIRSRHLSRSRFSHRRLYSHGLHIRHVSRPLPGRCHVAYIVMAYIFMACITMAYIVTDCTVTPALVRHMPAYPYSYPYPKDRCRRLSHHSRFELSPSTPHERPITHVETQKCWPFAPTHFETVLKKC